MMKTRRGRCIVALMAVSIAALAMASVAWACTLMVGQTYIDGYVSYPTSIKKGGTVPKIGAKVEDFGPADESPWSIRASKSGGCCSTWSDTLTDSNQILDRSDPDGWPLGQVDGKAPEGNQDQGTWQVCFLNEDDPSYATDYATFTVN